MANSKKPMNRISGLDFGSSEVNRIGNRFEKTPLAEQELKATYDRAKRQLNQLEDVPDSVIAGSTTMSRIMATAPNTMMRSGEQLDRSVNSRIERSNTQAMNAVERRFTDSSINSMSSQMSRDPNISAKSMGMAGMSYQDLAAQREKLQRQISTLGTQSTELAGSLFSKDGVNSTNQMKLDLKTGAATRMVGQMASVDAAMRLQESQGLDPRSKSQGAFAAYNQARSRQSANAIADEVANKGGISIKDVDKGGESFVKKGNISSALDQQSEALVKAFKELEKAVKDGKTDLDSYNKKIEDITGNIDKLKQGGESANEKRQSTMSYLSAAGGAFNAMGGAVQQITVGQRMQETANTSGFAGLANRQYDMYSKARGGDVASQLAMSQWDDAGVFGSEMESGTKMAQWAYGAAGATQAAAGTMRVIEGVKNAPTAGYMNSGVANNIADGAGDLVAGGSTMAVIAADKLRGASANAAKISGTMANMDARMAVQAVGAQQAQGLRNFYTDMDSAAMNMGGQGSAYIDNATSDAGMKRMRDARMSPEQYAQMSEAGINASGSTFNESQIFGARNAERAGYGSMATNIQRMGALAGAGSNNPKESMENVLSAAVAAGLDSSKSINMMVDNTASLASISSGAAVGIDTTAAISSGLAAGVNKDMGNKEMAMQQALTAAEMTRKVTTNRDVSFTGMANTAGLQESLKRAGVGIDGDQAINLQGIDTATLRSLRGQGAKAAAFFKDKGASQINETNSDKAINAMLEDKERQLIRPMTIASGLDEEKTLRQLKAGTLSSKDRDTLGTYAGLTGRTGLGEVERELGTIQGKGVPNEKGKAIMDGTGIDPKSTKAITDDLRTGGFKQLSEAAATAANRLKDFGGALEVFAKLQAGFEKNGMGNEKGFTTAAADMATSFSTSTGMFKDSVGEFATAVQLLTDKTGVKSNGSAVKPRFMNEGATGKMLKKVGLAPSGEPE